MGPFWMLTVMGCVPAAVVGQGAGKAVDAERGMCFEGGDDPDRGSLVNQVGGADHVGAHVIKRSAADVRVVADVRGVREPLAMVA